jgi:hypothetical protein
VSSSTGNDSTCASQPPPVISPSPRQACATINKGISLLRPSGSPDWLLLKTGDTFVGQDFAGSGTGSGLCAQSGISAWRHLLISSYGTGPRPIVEPTASNDSVSGGECAGGGNNLAIVGIEFHAAAADPNSPQYVRSIKSRHSMRTPSRCRNWILGDEVLNIRCLQ